MARLGDPMYVRDEAGLWAITTPGGCRGGCTEIRAGSARVSPAGMEAGISVQSIEMVNSIIVNSVYSERWLRSHDSFALCNNRANGVRIVAGRAASEGLKAQHRLHPGGRSGMGGRRVLRQPVLPYAEYR